MINKHRSEVTKMKDIKKILPGLIVSIGIGLISLFLAKFIPKLGAATIAIFLGMFVGNLFLGQEVFQKGYKFAESDLLAYSIVLLGGTISMSTLMELGWNGLIFIMLQMSVTIVAALYMGKKLGFSDNFRYLMASGNAVCGSSAIAATAPVIDADDKEKGIAITMVNVTGIFLMFIIPVVTDLLYGHETIKTSAMTGGILQSVGQVVASGAMVSEPVKDLATLFKILRVILLVVVVFILGQLKHQSDNKNVKKETEDIKVGRVKIPWYVIGFFVMCIISTIHLIPTGVSAIFKSVSNYFEVIALAAIGLKVNVRDLIKQGKAVSLYGMFIGCVQLACAIILITFLFN